MAQEAPTNGLKTLKSVGVPDGAVTALLIALAVLTAIPYVAGRDFGPYTIPDVLQGGTFWFLAVSAPLAWVALVANVFRSGWRHRKRALVSLLILEALALFLAFGSSTTINALPPFEVELGPAETSPSWIIDLPAVSRATQRLDVTIATIQGVDQHLNNGFGIHLSICGAAEKDCKGEQKGVNDTVAKFFQRGNVRISVFNFAGSDRDGRFVPNPRIKVALLATHLERRWF